MFAEGRFRGPAAPELNALISDIVITGPRWAYKKTREFFAGFKRWRRRWGFEPNLPLLIVNYLRIFWFFTEVRLGGYLSHWSIALSGTSLPTDLCIWIWSRRGFCAVNEPPSWQTVAKPPVDVVLPLNHHWALQSKSVRKVVPLWLTTLGSIFMWYEFC